MWSDRRAQGRPDIQKLNCKFPQLLWQSTINCYAFNTVQNFGTVQVHSSVLDNSAKLR